jgi:YihY family inner membrane protein
MSAFRRAARVLHLAARNFAQDRGGHHAAAVAYCSLLALAPSLYLLGRVFAALLPTDAQTTGAVVALIEPYFPAESTAILRALVEGLPRGNAIVAFAVPALVWLASASFAALELAFNTAFGTVPAMRFWLSRLKAVAGVTGLGIVLASTLALNQAFAWLAGGERRFPRPEVLERATGWVSYFAILGVTFASLMVLYKVLPRGKVLWSSAAWAAAPALVLWEGARHVFGGMLERSPAYGLLTGVLAGTVAFLLWVFTAVAITLYGAEVAAVLNGNRPARAPTLARRRVS